MIESKEERLSAIQLPRYNIDPEGESIWLDYRDRVIDTGDFRWLCAELKNAWEREAVMEKSLEFICRPEKIGEHGNPWFYRKSTAEEALAKIKIMRGEK